MPFVTLRPRRFLTNQQAVLNRQHPLAVGLVTAWHARHMAEVVIRDAVNPANNGPVLAEHPTFGRNAFGTTVRQAGALTAEGFVQPSGVGLPTGATAPWTIEVVYSLAAPQFLSVVYGFGGPINDDGPAGTKRYFMQFQGGNSDVYFWGDNADWATGIGWIFDSLPHQYVFSSNGTTLFLHVDGVPRASTALPALDTAGTEIVMGESHPAGASFAGDINYGRVWNRCLSTAEIGSLWRSPFQVFQHPRNWWDMTGVAVGATVTPRRSIVISQAVQRAATW